MAVGKLTKWGGRVWRRTCADCGAEFWGAWTAERCGACQGKRGRELARTRQQQRRQVRSGLWETEVSFSTYRRVPVRKIPRTCGHCGEVFEPERTTARFCSPTCRV